MQSDSSIVILSTVDPVHFKPTQQTQLVYVVLFFDLVKKETEWHGYNTELTLYRIIAVV